MSDAARHRRLKAIVLAAEPLRGDERERFIAAECAADEDLARAVRNVLGDGAIATSDVTPAGVGAPADGERAPERLGPFRIVRKIGFGGMGVVYEAQDERVGSRVAVKVIHAHLLGNARAEERFAREVDAGAQVDHPNVVRTLGAERVADAEGRSRSVLVTELVAGRTLRELLASLGRVPETLLREIARGIAHGVAAIHAAGIVHRDLKPENVMITTDSRVRVMDLGVARVLDASDGLTREGDFVGSLEYASPEQCEGRAAGPAADLYSLGVLLYEMASGSNPFARASSLATVAAHLTHDPPAAEGVSPFLAGVVAALLVKDPDRRFASARELARVLVEGEAGAWWRERAMGGGAAAAPEVPVARDLVLHGRDRELAALREALDAAKGGRASTVLVTGDAGLGKTRLLDSFLRGLGDAEVHRLYGSTPATGGPGGLADALLGALGGERAETWLVERAAMPEAFAMSVAAFLRREPPPPGGASLDDAAVEPALRRILRALAAERPTVLTLDDVHHAGPESGAQIQTLVRNLADARLLVVLAARPDPGARWTSELAPGAGFRSISLSRLGSDDIVAILRGALGNEDLARRAARRIAAKSGGIPLYVAAMLGSLRVALAAVPEDLRARVTDEVDVPMALREAVAARLTGLSAEERACLDVCVVQGLVFDAETAAAALGAPLLRVLQVLAEVERRLGLVHADGRRFRFDHQILADVIHESLPPRLREEYHLRTAQALAARARPAPEELARHLIESSDPVLAIPHLLPALDALSARHEGDAALRLATRALGVEGLLAGTRRADVLLRVTELHHVAGRRAEQAEVAAEALAIARTTRDLRLAAGAYAAVGRHVSDADEARRAISRLRAAIRLARRVGDSPLEVRASEALGSALVTLGRVDEARARLEAARALAIAAGDPAAENLARRGLGLVALGVGAYDAARIEFERCLELGRILASPRAEGHAEWGLGVTDIHAGNWDAARARFVRSRDIGRAIGDRALELNSLGNLSVCEQAAGRWADVAATLCELRPVVEEARYRTNLALLLVNLSQAWRRVGDADAARLALADASDVASALGFHRALAQVELCRGEAAYDAGDLAEARDRALDADREMIAAADTPGRVDVLLLVAAVARDTGDVAEALRATDEARAVAASLGRPSAAMLVAAVRATLPGGDAAAARVMADEVGTRAMVMPRMRARFDLYLADGDVRDLAEARRLVADSLAALPPERTRAAVEQVRLHRDIAAACVRAGLDPLV